MAVFNIWLVKCWNPNSWLLWARRRQRTTAGALVYVQLIKMRRFIWIHHPEDSRSHQSQPFTPALPTPSFLRPTLASSEYPNHSSKHVHPPKPHFAFSRANPNGPPRLRTRSQAVPRGLPWRLPNKPWLGQQAALSYASPPPSPRSLLHRPPQRPAGGFNQDKTKVWETGLCFPVRNCHALSPGLGRAELLTICHSAGQCSLYGPLDFFHVFLLPGMFFNLSLLFHLENFSSFRIQLHHLLKGAFLEYRPKQD